VSGPRAVVFTGPSLAPAQARAALGDLEGVAVAPPVARGDLARHRAAGARTFVIVDGVFAHRRAVAPSEIVDALAAGARVLGAASLGAIRAVECRPAGMRGLGAVYRLYRLGLLRDDDEVAVATDPEREFAAVSVALVNVRYAVLAALRRVLLSRAAAQALLHAARATYFADRTWPALFAGAGLEWPAPDNPLRALCEAIDVKRDDAVRAVGWLRRPSPASESPIAGRGETFVASWRTGGGLRYPGHDPLFGWEEAALQRELAGWLGTGEEPVALWERLAREGELSRALMRWYAAQRLGK